MTYEAEFESGKAKSSAIRNAVFARVDTGSVSNIELHLMFCLLNKKCTMLTHYLPAHWERIGRTATGAICCGAHITRICRLFDIELREQDAILGNQYLTFEALHHMEVVKIDMNLRAYVFQARQGDHFPLPCPNLTHVDVWEGDRSNWRMGTPAHRRVIAVYPFTGTWKLHVTPVSSLITDPGTVASSSGVNEENMEEEEDEPQPQAAGTSYRYHCQQDLRRRNREQRDEEPEDSITA